jgi:hypothetical protein
MKKIIRLTESDLVRLVKRVIKEQSPYAPGMGPKSSSEPTPRGVNPSLPKPKLELEPIKPKNPEWTKLKKDLVSSGFKLHDNTDYTDDQGIYQYLVKGRTKVGYADWWDNGTYVSVYLSKVLKSKLPEDIKTNSCYLDDGIPSAVIEVIGEGYVSLDITVKLSCKDKIKELISSVN